MFLLLMIFLLNSYSKNRNLLTSYKYDIKNGFATKNEADINLILMAWNKNTLEYEKVNEIPTYGYNFSQDFSYCKGNSKISYENGNVIIEATNKDTCYAYFIASDSDIVLEIYQKEYLNSSKILIDSVPTADYELISSSCSNNAQISFDNTTRKFDIKAQDKTVCEALFVKNNLTLNIFVEDTTGTYSFETLKYRKVENIPGINYSFASYTCLHGSTIKNSDNGLEFSVVSNDECNIYYHNNSDNADLIYMLESNFGHSGYTTGKKYSRTYSIPTTGYKYVGYLCDNSNAEVYYSNNSFTTSNHQTTCYAYFDREG